MYEGALWLGTQADGGLKRSLRRKERKERAAEQLEGAFMAWTCWKELRDHYSGKRMAMQSGVVQYEELLSAIEQGLAIGCH